MPINHDTTFVETDAPQRRGAVPRPGREVVRHTRPSATPRATRGSRSPGSRPGTRSRRSPQACSRWASSPSSASASRRAPATSGSWPTWRSCAPPAPPPRSTRRPTPRTPPTSSATPTAASSSPRTTSRSRSSSRTATSCPHLEKVITFDGAADGDWVISLDDLAALGDGLPRRAPRRHRREGRGHRARPARHPDLHLRHHRPPQGRAAAPQVLGLRGRGHPRPEHPRRERPAVPVAADGALVRQGAPLGPAGVRLRVRGRRPGREDRRQLRRGEADLHGCRAAHLREGLRPDPDDAGRRGWRQGEDLPQGVRGRPQGRAAQARGQVGPARRSRCSTASSTSSSSARCASASVDACASSSPAPPPSTGRSPSGSTPPAS